MGIFCVKSLRAIISRLREVVRPPVFHATNRGSNGGDHIVKHAALSDSESSISQIYWAIAAPDPRRILRTCRENIAYNTLPYKFARMLLLPQSARRRAEGEKCGLFILTMHFKPVFRKAHHSIKAAFE